MKDIRIGIGCGDNGRESVDELVGKVKDAEAAGFQAAWIPSFFQFDCLTWAALAGRETERIEIGTAVAVGGVARVHRDIGRRQQENIVAQR